MLLVAYRPVIGCLAVDTTDSATYSPARYSTRSSVSILGLAQTARLFDTRWLGCIFLLPEIDSVSLFGEFFILRVSCLFLRRGLICLQKVTTTGAVILWQRGMNIPRVVLVWPQRGAFALKRLRAWFVATGPRLNGNTVMPRKRRLY